MRFSTLLCIAFIAHVQSQHQYVRVSYEYSYGSSVYTCVVQESDVASEEFPVNFSFSPHLDNKTDADVLQWSANVLGRNSVKILTRGILDYVVEKFINLNSYSMAYTGIETIGTDAFERCEKLIDIYLQAGNISRISDGIFKNCLNVERLLLTRNVIPQIQAESFEGLGNLMVLDLMQNQLTMLDGDVFKNTPKLKNIQLSINRISSLSPDVFKFLVNLEELWMSHNEITHFHPGMFDTLVNLKVLMIDNNKISTFPAGLFANLHNFSYFSATLNRVRRLNKNSFTFSEKLSSFIIGSNDLDEIEPTFFENFPNLRVFSSWNNLCIDETIFNFSLIDTSGLLSQCYENWLNPRTTSTVEPSSGVKVNFNTFAVILMSFFVTFR